MYRSGTEGPSPEESLCLLTPTELLLAVSSAGHSSGGITCWVFLGHLLPAELSLNIASQATRDAQCLP